jgi:exonuclease SbcC
MILNRIHMVNFKRFRDQIIEFHDGITGIIGNNGAGKSTIIEGILFALYGVKGTGLEGEYIVSSSAPPRDKCEVRLEFQVKGEDYSILRTYKKTASSTQHSALININGGYLASGVAPVESQVRKIIGMGALDFKNTIFAGQKDLLSLLDETPGERKRWCMKMLGIDYLKNEADTELKNLIQDHERELLGYERVLREQQPDMIGARVSEMNEEMSGIQGILSDVKAKAEDAKTRQNLLTGLLEEQRSRKERWVGLKEQVSEIERHIQSLDGASHQLRVELETLLEHKDEFAHLSEQEKNYQELKPVVEHYTEKKERYDELSHEKTRIHGSIQQDEEQGDRIAAHLDQLAEVEATCIRLEPDLRRREDLIAHQSALREKEEGYRRLKTAKGRIDARYEILAERAHRNREELQSIEEQCDIAGINEMRIEIAACERERDALIQRIGSADQQIGDAETRMQEIDENLREIREAGEQGVCPTCHRQLGDHFHALVAEFEDESQRIQRIQQQYEGEKVALQSKRDEREQTINTLKKRAQEQEQSGRRYAELKKEQKHLVADVEECLAAGLELDGEIVLLAFDEEELHATEEELASLEPVWAEYISLKERISQRKSLEEELSSLSQRIDDRTHLLNSIDESIRSLAYDPRRYVSLREEYRRAEEAHHRYLEIQGMVARIPVIEQRMAEKESEAKRERGRLNNTREEIIRLEDSADLVNQYGEELRACREEMEDLGREIADNAARLTALGQRKQELEAELAKLQRYQSFSEQLREEVVLLKETRRMIGDYITYLLNVVRGRIESEVGRVLGEITSGRYENVLIDEDFTVFVNDMGENYPAHRFSGGEQDDIAIALRIALSRYLAEMHRVQENTFLIFDEIFGSQDEERRLNLLQALRTQEMHFPQIFLISHIPDIQGEFSTTLLVEMESDTESRVEEVSA